MSYTRERLRAGTVARLRTQLQTARTFLEAVEDSLDDGLDACASAEALSTTTDRVLASAAVLRALDSLEDKT